MFKDKRNNRVKVVGQMTPQGADRAGLYLAAAAFLAAFLSGIAEIIVAWKG